MARQPRIEEIVEGWVQYTIPVGHILHDGSPEDNVRVFRCPIRGGFVHDNQGRKLLATRYGVIHLVSATPATLLKVIRREHKIAMRHKRPIKVNPWSPE